MLNIIEDRKVREKKFHDQRYSEDKRKILSPIYDFAKNSKTLFNDIVTNINPGDNILEIGCGTNTISKKIVDMDANITIIDISEKAIEIAKQHFQEGIINISCVVMDAENLKFNDNSFDLVYGSGILHHLSIEKAIVEIKRVLKKDGRAIFYEPLGHNILINFFRSLTPGLRSEDEHPLLINDLELIKEHFPLTKFHYFYFLSLITIPFVKFPIFKGLIRFINRIDKLLNKIFPFIKKYNWVIIIEITA